MIQTTITALAYRDNEVVKAIVDEVIKSNCIRLQRSLTGYWRVLDELTAAIITDNPGCEDYYGSEDDVKLLVTYAIMDDNDSKYRVENRINTLEELAAYINATEDWQVNTSIIIERNGWEDLTGTEYGVCRNGNNKNDKNRTNCKKSSIAGMCSEERSMISSDYARNFIKDFILGVESEHTQYTLF